MKLYIKTAVLLFLIGSVTFAAEEKEDWQDASIVERNRYPMTDGGNLAAAGTLPRFGMEFAMPGQFSVFEFFGNGPFENYCDRNSAAMIGYYVQRVEDQYHWGYARTQESGTKTELKWMGVACVNSWGAWPREEHLVKGSQFQFTFYISPVNN